MWLRCRLTIAHRLTCRNNRHVQPQELISTQTAGLNASPCFLKG
nr:MAG TPA: hypothetical protein [Caudoviricetes sp.]DAM25213.1 MAG TPA: hypothetical protein [Caudoviricetes sp.]